MDLLKNKKMLQLSMFLREHYQRAASDIYPISSTPRPDIPDPRDLEMIKALLKWLLTQNVDTKKTPAKRRRASKDEDKPEKHRRL